MKFKKQRKQWSVIPFIPSLITVLAMTLGIHALKFLFFCEVEKAALCIVVAGFLDALDGKVARFLKASSNFGGTLDTLADFLNFGIAPAFGIYVKYFHVHSIKIFWVAVVFYIVCVSLRLARFSVAGMENGIFFKGVPAPGGAFLVSLPLCVDHAFVWAGPNIVSFLSVFSLFFSGILMISAFKTIGFSKLHIEKKYFPMLTAGLGVAISLLYLYTYLFIILLQLAYIYSVFASDYIIKKRANENH